MKKRTNLADKNSPWRRKSDAASYFSIGNSTLESLAKKAGAKVVIGGVALYNIQKIDLYLDDSMNYTLT